MVTKGRFFSQYRVVPVEIITESMSLGLSRALAAHPSPDSCLLLVFVFERQDRFRVSLFGLAIARNLIPGIEALDQLKAHTSFFIINPLPRRGLLPSLELSRNSSGQYAIVR
jgi:hypothetical protein